MGTFKLGDFVQRVNVGRPRGRNVTIPIDDVGTICEVVVTGESYKVAFSAFPQACVLVLDDSLRKADNGRVGPDCP